MNRAQAATLCIANNLCLKKLAGLVRCANAQYDEVGLSLVLTTGHFAKFHIQRLNFFQFVNLNFQNNNNIVLQHLSSIR